jgi:ubiquinone/menaquinone biosynthesis C-methylase UbiE
MLAVSAAVSTARRDRGGRVRLSREATHRIGWVLDNLLPPVLRDSRAVMWLAFRLFYRDQAETFLEFKTRVWTWTDEELADVYRGFAHRLVERPTDLSRRSFDAVLAEVEGPAVLEAGFGKGVLAEAMSRSFDVTAVDFVVDPAVAERMPTVTFVAANVEDLPFGDRSFDTVVCTHTLEHVRDFPTAVAELRRVAARKLVVMVPMQRPYRYTFDSHVHFFPYPHSLLAAMTAHKRRCTCEVVDGHLLYTEDLSEPGA